MNTHQAAAALDIPLKEIEPVDVNPLQIASMYFFRSDNPKNHRELAIDLLVEKGVSFTNEANCSFDLMRRYIKIVCPACLVNMTPGNGGGHFNSHTLEYSCPQCKTVAAITINNGGLGFRFPPADLSNVDIATLLQLPCTASALDPEWLKTMLAAEVVEIDSANDIASLTYDGNRIVAENKRTKAKK